MDWHKQTLFTKPKGRKMSWKLPVMENPLAFFVHKGRFHEVPLNCWQFTYRIDAVARITVLGWYGHSISSRRLIWMRKCNRVYSPLSPPKRYTDQMATVTEIPWRMGSQWVSVRKKTEILKRQYLTPRTILLLCSFLSEHHQDPAYLCSPSSCSVLEWVFQSSAMREIFVQNWDLEGSHSFLPT